MNTVALKTWLVELEEMVSRNIKSVCASCDDALHYSWLLFGVNEKLLTPLQLTPMVDCCVALLERPDLLPHPLSQSRIVSTLLVFINSDKMMTKALGNRSQYVLREVAPEGVELVLLLLLFVCLQATSGTFNFLEVTPYFFSHLPQYFHHCFLLVLVALFRISPYPLTCPPNPSPFQWFPRRAVHHGTGQPHSQRASWPRPSSHVCGSGCVRGPGRGQGKL